MGLFFGCVVSRPDGPGLGKSSPRAGAEHARSVLTGMPDRALGRRIAFQPVSRWRIPRIHSPEAASLYFHTRATRSPLCRLRRCQQRHTFLIPLRPRPKAPAPTGADRACSRRHSLVLRRARAARSADTLHRIAIPLTSSPLNGWPKGTRPAHATRAPNATPNPATVRPRAGSFSAASGRTPNAGPGPTPNSRAFRAWTRTKYRRQREKNASAPACRARDPTSWLKDCSPCPIRESPSQPSQRHAELRSPPASA